MDTSIIPAKSAVRERNCRIVRSLLSVTMEAGIMYKKIAKK